MWLAQWNPKWERYHFVSGHKRANESFRECMIREVGEELNLREDIEFTVAADPLARVEFEAWSESAEVETSYTMELFKVRFLFARDDEVPGGEAVAEGVEADGGLSLRCYGAVRLPGIAPVGIDLFLRSHEGVLLRVRFPFPE